MEENITRNSITLDQTALNHLNGSAKWSLFLAVMGFIGVAFMVIGAVFLTTVMSNIPGMPIAGFGPIMGGIYLVIAVLYFFPIYYLYQYSSQMKSAVVSLESGLATDALGYLKRHHKFMGIMILSMIGLYILIFVVIMVVAATAAF